MMDFQVTDFVDGYLCAETPWKYPKFARVFCACVRACVRVCVCERERERDRERDRQTDRQTDRQSKTTI